MFAQNLVQNNYPNITLTDRVALALQLMEDYDMQHLCVVDEKKFIAVIGKNDLLDAEENAPVSALQSAFIQVSVKPSEHFIEILKIFSTTEITIIPVVDSEKNFTGIITQAQLLKMAADLLGVKNTGAIIVLEVDRKNFSFGEISRLVETNDAYITQLNTLAENETMLLVTLKVNKTEVSDIISTFQRYDYSVKYFIGEEHYNNELQENYEHLISYLNI